MKFASDPSIVLAALISNSTLVSSVASFASSMAAASLDPSKVPSLTVTAVSDPNDAAVNWSVSFPAVNNVLILSMVSEANAVIALASIAAVVFPLIVVNSAAVVVVASPSAITIVYA